MNAILSVVFVLFSLFLSPVATAAEEVLQIKELPTTCVQESIQNSEAICTIVIAREAQHYPLFTKIKEIERRVRLNFDGKSFSIKSKDDRLVEDVVVIPLHLLPISILILICLDKRYMVYTQVLYLITPMMTYVGVRWWLIILSTTMCCFMWRTSTFKMWMYMALGFCVSICQGFYSIVYGVNFHGWTYYSILIGYSLVAVAIRHFFWKRNSVKDIVLPSDCHPGD